MVLLVRFQNFETGSNVVPCSAVRTFDVLQGVRISVPALPVFARAWRWHDEVAIYLDLEV